MLDAISDSNKSALQLRGSLFTLSVLHLQVSDLKAIQSELRLLIRQAPKFFENAPIVIDIQALVSSDELEFPALLTLLREHSLIPVGVRGGNEAQQQNAKNAGLALLSISSKTEEPQLAQRQPRRESSKESEKPTPKKIDQSTANNLIITKPVRSGQQIYARGGDLIVVGTVSNGAELLADGSIHVYGALRGRALAGVNGNTSARIFCQSMDADLVSIAGRYIVNETLIKTDTDIPQQVLLTPEGKLSIVPL